MTRVTDAACPWAEICCAASLPTQVNPGPASRRHFVSVLLFLLAVGIASLVGRLTSPSGSLEFGAGQRLAVYLRIAVVEWLLVAYLAWGMYRHGRSMGSILYTRSGARAWFSTIALGIGATVLWMVLGGMIMVALRPTTEDLRAVQSFLPRGVNEQVGFAFLTLTAGFCEELIYRGYLQQQFQALTGSLTLAILLQAGLFALLHVTLPWKFVVSVTAMAIFLGGLAGWRKTLVPAMLVHTLVNLFGGLFSSAGTTN